MSDHHSQSVIAQNCLSTSFKIISFNIRLSYACYKSTFINNSLWPYSVYPGESTWTCWISCLCLEIVHDGSMVCKSLYVLSIVLFSFALQLEVFHLIKYLGGENRIEPCFLCDLLYIIHECRKLPVFLCRILCVCFCVQEMKK